MSEEMSKPSEVMVGQRFVENDADYTPYTFEFVDHGPPSTTAPMPGVGHGIVWQGSADRKTWCEMPQHKAVEYPFSREYDDGRLVAEFYRDAQGKFRAAKLDHRAPTVVPAPAPAPLTARQILTARQRDRDRVRA